MNYYIKTILDMFKVMVFFFGIGIGGIISLIMGPVGPINRWFIKKIGYRMWLIWGPGMNIVFGFGLGLYILYTCWSDFKRVYNMVKKGGEA